MDYLSQKSHDFSIALNITEKPNNDLQEYNLYDELIACNTLDVVGELDVDIDLNADLD